MTLRMNTFYCTFFFKGMNGRKNLTLFMNGSLLIKW